MAVTDGKPNNITMAYHWARMIETLHSIEKIRDLLTIRPAGHGSRASRASAVKRAWA
jgi:coenzyme F420-reducing hydrogenase alpha subunit